MKTIKDGWHERGDQKGSRSSRGGRPFLIVPAVIILTGWFQNAWAEANSWTKPTSGFWEEQAYWSLGVLPNATQAVEFVNAGWKALVIGTNTVQNFPQSMNVQSLRVGAPTDSFNTLLMNFSGLEQVLRAGSLLVETKGAFQMQSAALEVGSTNGGDLSVGGTFSQGDFSQVKVHGDLFVGLSSGAAYYFTNGSLSVDGILHETAESIGRFGQPGTFIQYGGVNNARNIQVNVDGEFDLYGGQITATNGIVVGRGDFANYAYFNQYGGNVNADTIINGHYTLTGGTITGNMVMAESGQRVNASMVQTSGTNHAFSMDLGHPNRFGGAAYYQLSGGVIHVDSSTTFRGGSFGQSSGRHTIVSNLVMEGSSFAGLGNIYAIYDLMGGTLEVGGLKIQTAHLNQTGGTNVVAGDMVIGTIPAFPSQASSSHYTLSDGLLAARSITVNASNYAGFLQTGGTNQISDQLSVQGVTNSPPRNYTLEGGTLAVKDIFIGAGAFFVHTNGTIIHSNVLTLNQGGWQAATGNHSLGALKLGGGSNTNSTITFPGGSSILHLANSSAQSWANSAVLIINNWHGSTAGGGQTQLYFGSSTNGLTAPQLAQIKFSISGNLYSAIILATGEVVPQMQSLAFARSGNTLTLTWGPGWTLQSSTNVAGPYQDVPGASPYTLLGTNVNQFFRLRQ